MNDTIRPASGNDVLRWPDGKWVYRDELESNPWLKEGYEVITPQHPEYDLIVGLEQA